MTTNFWEKRPLDQMDQKQWESLCDHCGKCCVHKFIEDETDQVIYTKVACRLLDLNSCKCLDYKNRTPECMVLTIDDIEEFKWLPSTCAYRLLSEQKPLPSWHPLLTGSYETVALSGNSAKGKVIPEAIAGEDFLTYQVDNF
ncbi:MAG: YcgN family cysteine cluster protein [Lentisphaeria bacterium]|nr:YcgN family cysteine cluster protein [Lentisphaeria bacterium]